MASVIKIHVDRTKCRSFAHCVFAAPNVFVLDQNDKLEYTEVADDSELDEIKGAIELCPTQAISIVE